MAIAFSVHSWTARFFAAKCTLGSEKNFASHHFHRVPADANVDYTVIAARCQHKNSAGPVHFDPLLDKNTLVGLSHAMGHHPRRGAARGRPCGWIFAVVEHHPGVKASLSVHGFKGY